MILAAAKADLHEFVKNSAILLVSLCGRTPAVSISSNRAGAAGESDAEKARLSPSQT